MSEKITRVAIRPVQRDRPRDGWLVCVVYESGKCTVHTMKDKAAAEKVRKRIIEEAQREKRNNDADLTGR